MQNILYLSLIFLLLYIIILMKPGDIIGLYQTLSGIFFFTFCILFLIYIYKLKNSIISVIVTFIILFIFMYAIQILIGSIKYYLYKKND